MVHHFVNLGDHDTYTARSMLRKIFYFRHTWFMFQANCMIKLI